MSLIESYAKVKPSIVAFCAKYSNEPGYGTGGRFPTIIGTGFIIDSCGLILTNQHVVDAFGDQRAPSQNTDPLDRVGAVFFDVSGDHIKCPALEIVGVTKIASYTVIDPVFDIGPPDLALVAVKVKGLPSCQLSDAPTRIEEGMKVATAGFSMGTSGLTDRINGPVRQLAPVLQQGVISAKQPWAVETPHSFVINVLVQGGASGSPVFDPITGVVIGVLSASRVEPRVVEVTDRYGNPAKDQDGNQYIVCLRYPTSFSIIVPTYLIADKVSDLKKEMIGSIANDQLTLSELYSERSEVDFVSGKPLSDT